MTRSLVWTIALGAWSQAACAAGGAATQPQVAMHLDTQACDIAAASPWITRWLDAWELTSREILRLPSAPAPTIVFYDSACVYTTSDAVLPGIAPVEGPSLHGAALPWRNAAHNDSIPLPDGSRVPIALMSFTSSDTSGPYFVMAAPAYWIAALGRDDAVGFTGVFLHEFTHTRQLRGMEAVIGPIDAAWAYSDELTDDAVQAHFGPDSVYVAGYLAERDLLYRAAAADALTEARALAAEALEMMRSRHARWFTGDSAVFSILDDTFLSMEGAAQWAGYAWLAHPQGGGMERAQAVVTMLGRRRWWTQDAGLALFLVIDRIYPEWPGLVFGNLSLGATELLARAIEG